MSFRDFVSEARSLIRDACESLGYPLPEELEWDIPHAKDLGDVSFRTGYQLARTAKKKPGEIVALIAERINEKIKADKHYLKSVQGHPSGFLNFWLDQGAFFYDVLCDASVEGYGKKNLGNGSTVLVEHTSVNPNKALHVGHLRNVALGDSIARILAFTNHDVKIINYIDDSGLQVADIIVGIKHLGFPAQSTKKFDHYAGDDIYVVVNKKYETDTSLSEKRKQTLKALEEHDHEIFPLASKITNKILQEQLKTCWRFNASYDLLVFESDIIASKLWEDTFSALKKNNIAKLETTGTFQGCWIVTIKGEKEGEDKVLVRSDGTATYVAKDIPFAALKIGLVNDKFDYEKYIKEPDGHQVWRTCVRGAGITTSPVKWGADKSITAIGSEQSRLQRVILRVLEQLSGQNLSHRYIHLDYTLMTLSASTLAHVGKVKEPTEAVESQQSSVRMSGRKGLYINADDVFDAVRQAALRETKQRNPSVTDKNWYDDVAEKIAISAIRFGLLKQDLDKTITFDLEESLKLMGETGPYMLYTYARASSIHSKVDVKKEGMNTNFLNTESEIDLITLISKFDLNVEKAVKMLAPKWIAHYAFEICESFNKFYEKNRVIQVEQQEIKQARIVLVAAFQNVLQSALTLLGIKCLPKI